MLYQKYGFCKARDEGMKSAVKFCQRDIWPEPHFGEQTASRPLYKLTEISLKNRGKISG